LYFAFLLFVVSIGGTLRGWPLLAFWLLAIFTQIEVDNKRIRSMLKNHKGLAFLRLIFPEITNMQPAADDLLPKRLARKLPMWIISGIFVLFNIWSGGKTIREIFVAMRLQPVFSLSIAISFSFLLALIGLLGKSDEENNKDASFVNINRVIMLLLTAIVFILIGIFRK
jgi:hypothetical protein